MGSPRILFVDDEESIRITLPPVLREKGFEVEVAGSVAEALVEINSKKFDVLIADLNLAEEGDGFLVVSAMRHIQPQCVNLILTGYPALETALQAIHSQVDDYLTKPADLDALINTINEKLSGRKSQPSVRLKRLSALLNDHATDIVKQILDAMKQDPQILAIRLSDSELIGYVPSVLSALAQQLDSRQDTLNNQTILLVSEHGIRRKKKGYTLRMLIEEVHFLEQAVYDLVQKNWGTLDISILISELNGFQNGLHAIRQRIAEPFARTKKAAKA
jgi:ActR/RegA family two-component response regulator